MSIEFVFFISVISLQLLLLVVLFFKKNKLQPEVKNQLNQYNETMVQMNVMLQHLDKKIGEAFQRNSTENLNLFKNQREELTHSLFDFKNNVYQNAHRLNQNKDEPF